MKTSTHTNEPLKQLFQRTLEGEYTQLEEHAASFRVERKEEQLVIFFEKSNGAEDWKNNLDFPAKPYREMNGVWFVHRGFLRVFKALEPYIAPQILDPKVKKILLSGYSHGAALCLLAHEYAVFHRPEIEGQIQGFGFGCPRTVFGLLPKSVAARFRNFTVVRNRGDLVTHLPPTIFGFRHVGRMLSVGGRFRYSPIDAHRPENYLKELSHT